MLRAITVQSQGLFHGTILFMPTPRTWLPRIKEILAILDSSDAEELDRNAIEKLFKIKRRNALLLMNSVGPKKSLDGSYIVSRKDLTIYVRRIEETEGWAVERRTAVLVEIDERSEMWRSVRAKALEQNMKPEAFDVSAKIAQSTFSTLPPGVVVDPGVIQITFDPRDPVDACQKLYGISMALTNDLSGFLRILEGKAVSKETAVDDFLNDLEDQKATSIRNIA